MTFRTDAPSLLEGAVFCCGVQRLFVDADLPVSFGALGPDVPVQRGEARELLRDAARLCGGGGRCIVVAAHDGLLASVRELRQTASCRLPLVVVDVCGPADGLGSLSLLDHGLIQCIAQDAQEAADMVLASLALAEDPCVRIPAIVSVGIESLCRGDVGADPFPPAAVRSFFSGREGGTGVGTHAGDRYRLHRDLHGCINVLDRVEERFERTVGRSYGGAFEEYECDDADHILVTAGALASVARGQVDALRGAGARVGMVRVRYLRPFDGRMLALTLSQARSVGVLEADVSFGTEGTLFSNVNSALYQQGLCIPSVNFIAGLHGEAVTEAQVAKMFKSLMLADSKAADIVQTIRSDACEPAAWG